MKRIATIRQIGITYCGLPRDQRLAIKHYLKNPPAPTDPAIIEGMHEVLTDYCGDKPGEPGNYVLLDLLTHQQELVKVWRDERHGLVYAIAGQEAWHKLAVYNERYHRWLRLRKLNDDEIKTILASPKSHAEA
jgi:hypothetical protein